MKASCKASGNSFSREVPLMRVMRQTSVSYKDYGDKSFSCLYHEYVVVQAIL